MTMSAGRDCAISADHSPYFKLTQISFDEKTMISRIWLLVTGLLSLSFTIRAGASEGLNQGAVLARAYRSETNGWIYLHLEGPATERGFQHGYLLAREIAEEIRIRRILWKYES